MAKDRKIFKPSEPFSLGLELELEILDARGLDLAPGAPVLLREVPQELSAFLKPEAYQSMIELVTPVCRRFHDLELFLRDKLKLLEKWAERKGYLLFAASLHPFAQAKDQILFDDPRYRAIFEELKLVGQRFIAQGLHLHLGLPNEKEAVRLYNSLLPYLPLLLALTTSSPFYEGRFTGFHSYRTKLFEVLPLAGLPRPFNSWEEYESLLELLKRLEIIKSIRDLWWDIRIQPALGTVEIRIFDTPGRFQDLLAVVAFTFLLAIKFTEKPLSPPPREAILYGKWQAARHGLDGLMVDPVRIITLPIKQIAADLLNEIRPLAQELGLFSELSGLEEILDRGPTSYRMLALFRAGANLAEIVEIVRREFWREL